MKNSDAFMSSLSLLFEAPGPKDMIGPARAYIRVKQYTRHNDQIVLTPDAMGYVELEGYINGLMDELEDIKRKAKKRFAAHDAKTRSK